MSQFEFSDNKIENKPDMEKVNFYVKETINSLKTCWEIDHLSIIELSIIRKLAEDVLKRYDPKLSSDDQFEISEEIGTRFLIDAYGIDPGHIKSNTKSEEDKEEFLEYIRRIRNNAHLI